MDHIDHCVRVGKNAVETCRQWICHVLNHQTEVGQDNLMLRSM